MKKPLKVLLMIVSGILILTGCESHELKPSVGEVFSTEGAIVTISPDPGKNALYPRVNFFMIKEDQTLDPLLCSHYDHPERSCNTADGKVLLEFDHKRNRSRSYIKNVRKTTLGNQEYMDCWKPDGTAYVCMPRGELFLYEESKKLAKEKAK